MGITAKYAKDAKDAKKKSMRDATREPEARNPNPFFAFFAPFAVETPARPGPHWVSPEGRSIGSPTFTGVPKSGVPSGRHSIRCIRGERRPEQPRPGSGLAW